VHSRRSGVAGYSAVRTVRPSGEAHASRCDEGPVSPGRVTGPGRPWRHIAAGGQHSAQGLRSGPRRPSMIYIFAGFVLLTIELVMLSMLMSKKEVLADGPRSAFWWEQLVILYHLPSIVLVALVSREKSGPYWVVSVVTFVAYLALF